MGSEKAYERTFQQASVGAKTRSAELSRKSVPLLKNNGIFLLSNEMFSNIIKKYYKSGSKTAEFVWRGK